MILWVIEKLIAANYLFAAHSNLEYHVKQHQSIQLGVNVDHIATLRQARGTSYPDPVQAASIAREAGADGITVHLREDRRHIQDHDVYRMLKTVALPLNLEMAATLEMQEIALDVCPAEVCLVPEKRAELSTEGGLNVAAQVSHLSDYIRVLSAQNILVSLFIDADPEQITAARTVGADIIELHTGRYADELDSALRQAELDRIIAGAEQASQLELQVNAGHGLHYQNVQPIAAIRQIACLNIGHSIVARASISGFHEAVFSMKQLMIHARLAAEAAV